MASLLPPDLDRILHDLRGPLNAVVMHLEVLRRLVGDQPSAKQSLDTAQQEIERLAAMLTTAFDVLAVERGDFARVDLHAVVKAVTAEPDFAAVTVAPDAWPPVRGDRALLAVAVRHLLRNAVDAAAATAHRRPPEIHARVDDASVSLVVRDWGPGLASLNPKVLIRLTSGRAGEAGVRLVAVERIARLHGGELGFERHADGAETRLTLPRL